MNPINVQNDGRRTARHRLVAVIVPRPAGAKPPKRGADQHKRLAA